MCPPLQDSLLNIVEENYLKVVEENSKMFVIYEIFVGKPNFMLHVGTKVSSGNNKGNEVARLEIFISPLTSTYKEIIVFTGSSVVYTYVYIQYVLGR
jgi:hypothetical protein